MGRPWSRRLMNGTAGGGRADKSRRAQRVENQGILRFMTQRAGQAWGQVCPPLWASAFCLGSRVQALPLCTGSQQPHPGVQCWLNSLCGVWAMGKQVGGRLKDDNNNVGNISEQAVVYLFLIYFC